MSDTPPGSVDPHTMTQSGSCTSFGRRSWRRSTPWVGMPSRNTPHAPDQHPTVAEELKERGE